MEIAAAKEVSTDDEREFYRVYGLLCRQFGHQQSAEEFTAYKVALRPYPVPLLADAADVLSREAATGKYAKRFPTTPQWAQMADELQEGRDEQRAQELQEAVRAPKLLTDGRDVEFDRARAVRAAEPFGKGIAALVRMSRPIARNCHECNDLGWRIVPQESGQAAAHPCGCVQADPAQVELADIRRRQARRAVRVRRVG